MVESRVSNIGDAKIAVWSFSERLFWVTQCVILACLSLNTLFRCTLNISMSLQTNRLSIINKPLSTATCVSSRARPYHWHPFFYALPQWLVMTALWDLDVGRKC